MLKMNITIDENIQCNLSMIFSKVSSYNKRHLVEKISEFTEP